MKSAGALAIVIALQANGWAQASQADIKFAEGRDLMAAGKFAEACAAFEASEKLDPSPGTLLNLGDCREKNHQLATAWKIFHDVEEQMRNSLDAKRRGLREVAASHAAKLVARLSHLTIAVRDPVDKLEVTRDGVAIAPGELGVAVPIDGGSHKITASAPGYEPYTVNIAIGAEGEAQTIELPKLVERHEAPPPPPPQPQKEPPTTETEPEPEQPAAPAARAWYRSPLPYGIGAGVLAATAGLLELSAEGQYDDAKGAADRATQVERWNTANDRRHIAQGLAGATVVAGGLAVGMWVAGRSHDRVAVQPVATTTLIGLVAGGRF
jgi:hypothetical protein